MSLRFTMLWVVSNYIEQGQKMHQAVKPKAEKNIITVSQLTLCTEREVLIPPIQKFHK